MRAKQVSQVRLLQSKQILERSTHSTPDFTVFIRMLHNAVWEGTAREAQISTSWGFSPALPSWMGVALPPAPLPSACGAWGKRRARYL